MHHSKETGSRPARRSSLDVVRSTFPIEQDIEELFWQAAVSAAKTQRPRAVSPIQHCGMCFEARLLTIRNQ